MSKNKSKTNKNDNEENCSKFRGHLICWTFYTDHHNLPKINIPEKWSWMIYSMKICPSTKNMHFQGTVHFHEKHTQSSASKLFKKLWGSTAKCKVCRGITDQNIIYCSKDNISYEWSNKPNQSARNDLNKIDNECLQQSDSNDNNSDIELINSTYHLKHKNSRQMKNKKSPEVKNQINNSLSTNNTINHSLSIKFTIFDNIILTKKQNEIREKLCDMKVKDNDLKKILKEVSSELNDIIKFLDRLEPSICSLDEKKQLRTCFVSLINQNKKESNSIIFNQNHLACEEYFTSEELTIISQKIKEKIESYLQYKIAEPIIYNAREDNKEDNKIDKSKPVWGKIEGNKVWKRKPRDDPPEYTKFRNEDLFLCHNCKDWLPWFKYCNGKIIALSDIDTDSDNIYEYMNDDKDRGGRRWACDNCIDKILYDNNIITIT